MATSCAMTNAIDDAVSVPPTLHATEDHADVARGFLATADDLDDLVARKRLENKHEEAGRILNRQRSCMKRAEVHALLAIADELARIGLAR